MKTLHVGGLNPLNRFKTLSDALVKAQDDDTIELHKNIQESNMVTKNIIIKGNGHTLTTPQGKVGLKTDTPLEISDLKLVVNPRANGINTSNDLVLTKVDVELVGPVREFYPSIKVDYTNNPSIEIYDSKLQMINIGAGVRGKMDGVTLTSYYGGDIMLSTREDMNKVFGNISITNSEISSTILGTNVVDNDGNRTLYGNIVVENSTIHKFVDIDSATRFNNVTFDTHHDDVKKNQYKNEPDRGPLQYKTDNKYAVAVRTGAELEIENYQVEKVDKDFLALYANQATVTAKNINQPTQVATHKMVDTTIAFENVHDQNFWSITGGTVARVRTDLNSNQNYVTAMDKIDGKIGQQTVKDQLHSIMDTIEMNRKSSNSEFQFAYNMVFAGNPGTGKSTFANDVAQALFEIGAIPKNKFTKATSDEFVKGYIGQTGENTRKILDNALGGVLFIDEAYELTVRDDEKSFNSEVISVLIRYMEEHRDDLVVIAAGYNKEMKEFLASNVGLDRRFQWVQFEDYTNHEMKLIFEQMRQAYGDEYQDPMLADLIEPLFQKLTQTNLSIPDARGRVNNGGNGGLVRNVYQAIAQARNTRVMRQGGDNHLTKEDIAIGFKSQIEKALARKITND